MGNMSYCRFQNTLSDLLDCYENMEDDLSWEEKRARDRLLKLCTQIVEDYGYGLEFGDEISADREMYEENSTTVSGPMPIPRDELYPPNFSHHRGFYGDDNKQKDENTMSEVEHQAYAKFADLCHGEGKHTSDFERVKQKLESPEFGYKGAELWGMLTRIVEKPIVKDSIESGVITSLEDLNSVLRLSRVASSAQRSRSI